MASSKLHFIDNKTKIAILLITTAVLVILTFLLPPISQPLSYHDFADKRAFFGIPHALDVLSNLPLLMMGMIGMVLVLLIRLHRTSPGEKVLWLLLFGAAGLTAVGSAYYHLQPNHYRLAFDRCGLSLLFMSFLSLMLSERIDKKIGLALAPFLILLGIGSVVYWLATDDVRFYGLVQFGSTLLVLGVLVLFRPIHPGTGFLYLGLGLYGLSKICEVGDWQIYGLLGETISGHSLKHIFSAGGIGAFVAYLSCRLAR